MAPPGLDLGNVLFDTPSQNASGAVPLGNGEVGASVWIEPTGDLVMYLCRPDSFSEVCRLLKVGALRIHLDPSPLSAGAPFRQELKLRQGRLEVDLGGTHLEVFADADRPVLRVLMRSQTPVSVTITDIGWRREPKTLTGTEAASCRTMRDLPASIAVTESADVLLGEALAPAALAWYHHNATSVVPFVLAHQSCDDIPGVRDPLFHRTFGAWIEGKGLKRSGERALASASALTTLDLRIACPTAIVEDPQRWVDLARTTAASAPAGDQARIGTENWWSAFWNRSWILPSGSASAEAIATGYTRSRWLIACQGRGQTAIKFNGGMFAVEPVYLNKKLANISPDYVNWGDCYWWQNTRHMYHPMLPAGDRDMMDPLFDLYQNTLPLAEARTKRWYGAEGAYFPETMTMFGSYAVHEYGYDRTGMKVGDIKSPWWRYAWNQGPELVSLMLDTWDWTQDATFVQKRLVPMAKSVLTYFDTRFKRDERGLLVLDPCMVLEMYRDATNDLPTIAGLRAIIPRLQALPTTLVPATDRDLYARILAACPPVPTQQKVIGTETATVLAPAARYSPKPSNKEHPEIYAVWPYRLYSVGKPELDLARTTFASYKERLEKGWGYDANAAALMGLTDQAASMLVTKSANSNKAYRFPASWGPNFDWLPDMNHAGNLMNTAQLMLLQYTGRTIHLLPAWPATWDCQFRLHAPVNTVVEGEVKDGKLIRLEVIPTSRREDVVICAPYRLP